MPAEAEERTFLIAPGILGPKGRSGRIVVAIDARVLLVRLRNTLFTGLVLQKSKRVAGFDIGRGAARSRAAGAALALCDTAQFLLDLSASLGKLDCKFFPLLLGLCASVSSVVVGELVFP